MGNGPAKLCLFPAMLLAILTFDVVFRELAFKDRGYDLSAPTKPSQRGQPSQPGQSSPPTSSSRPIPSSPTSQRPSTTPNNTDMPPATTSTSTTRTTTTSTSTTPTIPKYPGIDADGYCRTEGCKKTAETFLSVILPTADPCQDFFKFACGKFIQDNPLGPGVDRTGMLWVLEDNIRNAVVEFLHNIPSNKTATPADKKVFKTYKLCLDTAEAGIKPIRDIVRKMGGPPFAGKRRPSLKTLLELTGGSFPLFAVDALGTMDRRGKFIHLRTVEELDDEERFAKLELVKAMWKKLAQDFDGPELPAKRAKLNNGLNAYRRFLKKLEEFRAEYADNAESEGPQRIASTPFSHPAITRQFPKLPIMESLKHRFPIHAIYDTIYVQNVDYFGELNKYVGKNTDIVKEAIVVEWFLDRLQVFGAGYENIRKEFAPTYTPLPVYCAEQILTLHPRWADALLLERLYPQRLFDGVYDLHKKVLAGFREIIQESPWADPPTQKKAIKKINAVPLRLGADWTWSRALVEQYYQAYTPADANSWFAFHDNLKLFAGFWNFTNADDEMHGNTDASNDDISLHFNWGLMTTPYYHADASLELRFGGLGHIIGHEMGHSLDPEFIQNSPVLVGKEDKRQFREQVECIEHQYENANMPLDSYNETFSQPGELTHAEAIADNAGLRAAFRAYRNERKHLYKAFEPKLPELDAYTPDQLFFVAAAMINCGEQSDDELLENEDDEHPPGHIRVNEEVKNSRDFARAYKCPLNSPMNPERKCRVWRYKKRKH